jgi:CDP-glucose 4,6-dehydratase
VEGVVSGRLPDPRFWAGRRVLVTGHTGFKGAWLALWLERLGAEIVGYALEPPTRPSLYELARVGAGLRHVTGDVRDLDRLVSVVRRERPEVVVHMAAQSLVRRGRREPVETYAVNVMGTVHLLEAVRRGGAARAVVNVTSDKCYENREWEWGYREDEPKGGRDPYSSSKGCAELVSAAYRSSFFGSGGPTRLASARAGNVIGGGDFAEDRLVPDLMRAALAGDVALVRNPGSVRPWQHVLEPLAGYLLLAERLWDDPSYADGWNFGPDEGDARPVGEVADALAALWGRGLEWRLDPEPQPTEARYLKLDSSRARLRLGWRPGWGLRDALAGVAEWWRAHAAGADLRSVTLDQIGRYESGEAAAGGTAATTVVRGRRAPLGAAP